MQRFIVLACDSESPYVRVLDVEQQFSGTVPNQVEYVRSASRSSLFLERIGPRLYGQLQAILFSSETIANAAPIEPDLRQDLPDDGCGTEDAELDRKLKEVF